MSRPSKNQDSALRVASAAEAAPYREGRERASVDAALEASIELWRERFEADPESEAAFKALYAYLCQAGDEVGARRVLRLADERGHRDALYWLAVEHPLALEPAERQRLESNDEPQLLWAAAHVCRHMGHPAQGSDLQLRVVGMLDDPELLDVGDMLRTHVELMAGSQFEAAARARAALLTWLRENAPPEYVRCGRDSGDVAFADPGVQRRWIQLDELAALAKEHWSAAIAIARALLVEGDDSKVAGWVAGWRYYYVKKYTAPAMRATLGRVAPTAWRDVEESAGHLFSLGTGEPPKRIWPYSLWWTSLVIVLSVVAFFLVSALLSG